MEEMMEKKKLNVASNHVDLTSLAVQVYILGHSVKADELKELEEGLDEFQIRWAYCCAGISAGRIDELMTQKSACVPT
jgi:hypothetical protein